MLQHLRSLSDSMYTSGPNLDSSTFASLLKEVRDSWDGGYACLATVSLCEEGINQKE